jgi:hypothetical protein
MLKAVACHCFENEFVTFLCARRMTCFVSQQFNTAGYTAYYAMEIKVPTNEQNYNNEIIGIIPGRSSSRLAYKQ